MAFCTCTSSPLRLCFVLTDGNKKKKKKNCAQIKMKTKSSPSELLPHDELVCCSRQWIVGILSATSSFECLSERFVTRRVCARTLNRDYQAGCTAYMAYTLTLHRWCSCTGFQTVTWYNGHQVHTRTHILRDVSLALRVRHVCCFFFCCFFSGHCVQVVETVASACHVASACQLLEYAEPQKSRDYSQR